MIGKVNIPGALECVKCFRNGEQTYIRLKKANVLSNIAQITKFTCTNVTFISCLDYYNLQTVKIAIM